MSTRAGLVALAGRPNVGKSTLANALVGRHVAGVSPRPQTTRRRISAVVEGEDWQAVLLDLPGFQRPVDRMTARMQRTVDTSLGDCDAALYVVSADEPIGGGDRFIAERLRAAGRPVIVAVTKVDRARPEQIAAQIATASSLVSFEAVHPVSALRGDGIDALKEDLPLLLPEGPRLFPKGVTTDQSDEELAAELIRESALERLRQELPHALAVVVDEIAPAAGGGLVIRADLLVEHASQKGIVIGKGGAMIAAIGTAARHTLSAVFGTPVHVDLRVRVRKRWRDDESMLERLQL